MGIRSCKETWRQGDKEFRTIVCGNYFLAEICLELPELPVSLSPNKTPCLLVSKN